MTPLRIAIVGFGKIARDQHVPAIAATEGAVLAAIASRDIDLGTDEGPVTLSSGGAKLSAGGGQRFEAAEAEYVGLYRRFVELTATGEPDVDLAPPSSLSPTPSCWDGAARWNRSRTRHDPAIRRARPGGGWYPLPNVLSALVDRKRARFP